MWFSVWKNGDLCENEKEHSLYTNDTEFPDEIRDYLISKKDSIAALLKYSYKYIAGYMF
jgi:hypothetical protein